MELSDRMYNAAQEFYKSPRETLRVLSKETKWSGVGSGNSEWWVFSEKHSDEQITVHYEYHTDKVRIV